MNSTTYNVTGMTCGGCVNTLKRALKQAFPSNEVEVVLDGGVVRIDGSHDRDTLRQVVDDAGFDNVDPPR